MRTLPLPTDTQNDVFALCLAATTDLDLYARLAAIGGHLNSASISYQTCAESATLNLIQRIQSVGAVTKPELTGLYETHLSKTKGAARAVYDRIRNAAPNNICPLCGVGVVAHCDHHLPKSSYPDLSILPMNLVPACHSCNNKKRAKFPATVGQQTFHPYFDQHLLADPWVRATLHRGPPPTLAFDTAPPPAWPPLDKDRVRRHFDACGLATTFTANANNELPTIRGRLIMQATSGGATAVQRFLNEERNLRSQQHNSWQYATYCTLAADSWFVNGGYSTIP